MGCGGSKFEPEAEKLPPRIRQLLRRRFEDIRKRRNVVSDTLSNKELLKDATADQDISIHKTISSRKESVETAAEQVNNKDSDQAVEAPKQINIKQASKGDEEKENIVKNEDEMKDEMETEEENRSRLSTLTKGGGDGQGSPSFRVYYIESLDNNDDEDGNNNDSDKKSGVDDSDATSESVNSNRSSGSKTSKKGNRFRRMMMIPKGRQAAVKNLLKVKSCYNPARAGNDNARLVEETKTA